MNDHDLDIPLLTDILDRPASAAQASASAPPRHLRLDLMQEALAERIAAELAVQVPVLVENALREQLADALGSKLQAELLTILTNALPAAAQAASEELSAHVAYQVGGLLERRLPGDVRDAVAKEITRLNAQQN